MGLKVPEEIGIIGFANEAFDGFISPSLSSVDQKSKELGKDAANIYSIISVNRSGPSIPESNLKR
ncbi:MAG: substrate-binding domain-containing protein [Bacteroidota bacterium]|nr:substrate-binding domain-containing protein [Bacteroidota bacterium]